MLDLRLEGKVKIAILATHIFLVTFVYIHVTKLPKGIPENEFQECFLQWHYDLTKCITSQVEYFEDDSSH